MDQMTRHELARELAKAAEALLVGAVGGCLVIVVHPNEATTTILAPPNTKKGAKELLAEVDKALFRLKAVMYLGPKGGSPAAPIVVPEGEKN